VICAARISARSSMRGRIIQHAGRVTTGNLGCDPQEMARVGRGHPPDPPDRELDTLFGKVASSHRREPAGFSRPDDGRQQKRRRQRRAQSGTRWRAQVQRSPWWST
jgi:hypothetical protein